jgi:hypothetical protein
MKFSKITEAMTPKLYERVMVYKQSALKTAVKISN